MHFSFSGDFFPFLFFSDQHIGSLFEHGIDSLVCQHITRNYIANSNQVSKFYFSKFHHICFQLYQEMTEERKKFETKWNILNTWSTQLWPSLSEKHFWLFDVVRVHPFEFGTLEWLPYMIQRHTCCATTPRRPQMSRSHCFGATTSAHASGCTPSIAHVQSLAPYKLISMALASQTFLYTTSTPADYHTHAR